MPRAGNYYYVEIKPSHIDWGGYRHTETRDRIAGEAYVKIPRHYAEEFNIRLGSCYTAIFADGYDSFIARASGNSFAGDVYAKQFQGNGDLKAFGYWYQSVGAKIGDMVKVEFVSESEILFTHVPR